MKYAGQKLSTGKQAECYANDFIGEHVKDVAGGKTYAGLGGPERASTPRSLPPRRPTIPPSPTCRSSTPP